MAGEYTFPFGCGHFRLPCAMIVEEYSTVRSLTCFGDAGNSNSARSFNAFCTSAVTIKLSVCDAHLMCLGNVRLAIISSFIIKKSYIGQIGSIWTFTKELKCAILTSAIRTSEICDDDDDSRNIAAIVCCHEPILLFWNLSEAANFHYSRDFVRYKNNGSGRIFIILRTRRCSFGSENKKNIPWKVMLCHFLWQTPIPI